jgi:TolB-like protein/Flp pilus assembly protein TadD
VDSRADIFSAGVLLYEMLTGFWPFRGKTAVDVRHAVLHEDPVPLAEARPGPFPVRLQQILDKALAKDPNDRYQKVAQFRDDLVAVTRELGAPSGIELAPVAPRHLNSQGPVSRALRWLKSVTGAEPTSAPRAASGPGGHETPTSVADRDRKSVAILPFKNLGNDGESAFYEFSLADAVITELARVRSLVVRASSVIVKYQGKAVDPAAAGKELGVDAILTASFLRSGDRLRVTAQLLDVGTSEILWSDRLDADASDVIGVQDTIVNHIVEGLRLELSPDEKQELGKGSTADGAASEEYLRGRHCLGQFIYHTISREDVDSAIQHFKRAIELDQNFALAYSALGGCYVNRALKGLGDPGDHAKAEAAFKQALALDPRLLEARMHMIFIYLSQGQKSKAREEVERLRHEYPNDVGVHFVRGVLARLDSQYERALRSFDRMVKLNPAEIVVASYNRARLFMYQGRHEEALKELDRGAALEPEHPLIQAFRSMVFYYQGRIEEATDLMEKVLESHPRIEGIRPILAMCLSAQGKHQAASEQLTQRVKQVAASDHDISYWLASAYLLQGKQVEAFRWLETSIGLGNENIRWFLVDPNWIDMHEDPRFKELIARITPSTEHEENHA